MLDYGACDCEFVWVTTGAVGGGGGGGGDEGFEDCIL